MKIGLIPPYAVGPVEERDFALGFARLAEELGFESVFAVEHVVLPVEYRSTYPYDPGGRMPYDARTPQPDPLIWLAAASAVTDRLRLATGVLELPLRNPVVLAKELATLDRLAGGRLLLGVGLGWMREEAEAVGVSFDDRARRADEALRAMRCLWREPVASFEGTFVRFREVRCEPRPLRPEGIPVIVGGHSEAAARRAGRHGDGLYPLVPPDRIPALRAIMEEEARRAGRSGHRFEITTVGAADPAAAEALAGVGVDRMLVPTTAPDLGAARRELESIADRLEEYLGSAAGGRA